MKNRESTTALYRAQRKYYNTIQSPDEVSLCTSNRLAGGAKKRKYYSASEDTGPRIRALSLVKGESTTALYIVSLCTSNRLAGNTKKD